VSGVGLVIDNDLEAIAVDPAPRRKGFPWLRERD
jgi:hypothetical protein